MQQAPPREAEQKSVAEGHVLRAGEGRSWLTASEWQVLEPSLQGAVAGQVVWGDQPLELLAQGRSSAWRWAALRPGPWIGGLAEESSLGHDDETGGAADSNRTLPASGVSAADGSRGHLVRPGAGLAQLRALQWCGDAIRWHEKHVLGYEYSHVLYARWDLQWLIPFPGLALLQAMDPEAVWLVAVQGEFYANDRFAVVPRLRMSSYFDGWRLLVSGKAAEVFESVLPRAGAPVTHSDHVNCEAFLFARLVYGSARIHAMPPMFYVHCTPTNDSRSLRSLGYFYCASIADLVNLDTWVPGYEENWFAQVMGGAKYAIELDAVLATDALLQGRASDFDAWRAAGAVSLGRLFTPRFQDAPQTSKLQWNPEDVASSSFLAIQLEVEAGMERGWCTQVREWRTNGQ
ncbi:unnamed protein product [Polarella glacialis]|uniref:Uncharacterized protein n=1 Tax=Polarella glacialis TaxID=89957 RepID=A0A813JHJ0_POLGL|nr:unnamed protein product [Polarella glacialis]